MRYWIVLPSALLLVGCAAKFGDKHLFATVDPVTNQVVNIFRVRVDGHAELANARYISGYYDERAVDLFFNEVRATDLSDTQAKSGVEQIFKTVDCSGKTDAECAAAQDKHLRTVPLGSLPGKQGAFVMILSTNADAIAGTIGAFAENESVVQSVMYLTTSAQRKEAAAITARSDVVAGARKASIDELTGLFSKADQAGDASSRTQLYLAILQATAAGLAPNSPPSFATAEQARAWFAAQPRGGSQ